MGIPIIKFDTKCILLGHRAYTYIHVYIIFVADWKKARMQEFFCEARGWFWRKLFFFSLMGFSLFRPLSALRKCTKGGKNKYRFLGVVLLWFTRPLPCSPLWRQMSSIHYLFMLASWHLSAIMSLLLDSISLSSSWMEKSSVVDYRLWVATGHHLMYVRDLSVYWIQLRKNGTHLQLNLEMARSLLQKVQAHSFPYLHMK